MLLSNRSTSIFDLSFDTKIGIINLLDNISLACLSETCTYFASLVRSILSYRNAYISTIQKQMPTLPPFLNFRAGVAIGHTFYLPFLSEIPFCYVFDLTTEEWSTQKLKVAGFHEFHSQVTSAAAIGKKIYLVGGRLLKSYTLSNSMVEIDTATFTVRVMDGIAGSPPRPRHEHSVDAVANRYLVVFGGLCYNSVGENDVFVYDLHNDTWFVPNLYGQFPHLRFGHASTVIGCDLYIHGGAQIDSDSSYIIYDDLYKLDCINWVWYKYEHPEVERYLRNQPQNNAAARDYLISTSGNNPHDRFQSNMCAASNKLIIFGGHSIRVDEDDNEVLFNYTLDELFMFNTKRYMWSSISAKLLQEEDKDYLTVSNMCAAAIPGEPHGFKIVIFAGRKVHESARRPSVLYPNKRSSSSGSSNSLIDSCRGEIHQPTEQLQSIIEHDLSSIDDSEAHTKIEGAKEGELRTPDDSQQTENVKKVFNLTEPDVEDNNVAINQVDGESNGNGERSTDYGLSHLENSHKNTRNSSISSQSSDSHEGISLERMRRQTKIVPCIVVIDLQE